MSKLGVVVPYRNRRTHLNHFLTSIKNYLTEKQIEYELIIVEQADTKSFNRGKLLNIGVLKARDLGCDYVALHDIDMLPIDVDYSPVRVPTHLATNFIEPDKIKKRIIFDEYFGGVTLFPIEDYFHVNGYSNNYWGWGYEDDDLLFRCKENFIDFNTKQLPSIALSSAALYFNGHTSSVKFNKDFNLADYTIFISFKPDDIECNDGFTFDEYNVFCIPGFDTAITYNAYKRYKFETFDSKKRVISLKSNIIPPKRTTLAVTVNHYNKEIRLYQDGKVVDSMEFDGRLMRYPREVTCYFGNSPSLKHNKRRPFKGELDYFAIFNHSLEEAQIEEISNNKNLGLTEKFGDYVTPHTLEVCYDMKSSTNKKIFDLSGKYRDGKIIDCDRVPITDITEFVEIPVPYRRESTFELLPHKENGFYENKWTWTDTRKNQLYFYNKVLKGKTNYKRDGIDNVRFELLNDVHVNNEYHFISAEL